MRRTICPAVTQWLRTVFLTSLLVAASGVLAETAVDERLLGLTESALIGAVPGLKKLPRPIYGPHGLRGIWSLTRSRPDEWNFQATFYFRNDKLERIEHRRRSPEDQCSVSYAKLVTSLESRYGVGVYSGSDSFNADQNQTAAWVSESFKVMAYRIQLANQCDLLVAIEAHKQKDATNL